MKWCIILLLLFIIYLTETHACGGGGGWGAQTTTRRPSTDNSTNTTTPTTTPAPPSRDPYDFDGFDKPPGALDFDAFMRAYNKSLIARAKASGDYGRNKPADAGDDWPVDWNDMGLGIDGMPPPPWSYKPLNTGKSAFCHIAPAKGDCGDNSTRTEESERWAYNPYMDECKTFNYSGCFGNQNNFRTKLRCQQACLTSPWDGCDLDSHIPKLEHRRACPLTDQQLYKDTVRDYSNVDSNQIKD